jgi:hypothetical protein
MMRKILGIVGLAVIAAVVALNINAGLNRNAEMDSGLANVEALVQGEGGSSGCSTSCDLEFCDYIYINGSGFYLQDCRTN